MPLESLLLCNEPQPQKVLKRLLIELGVHVDLCPDAAKALARLAGWRFDAVIVDCDGVRDGFEVLKAVRTVSRNKRAVTFAMASRDLNIRDAFGMGANFVLEKPLLIERTTRWLRAAHGMMVRERIRNFRQPVEAPIHITDGLSQFPGVMVNLSGGGMSIRVDRKFEPNSTFRIGFNLPGTTTRIEIEAELIWVDTEGRRGVRFVRVSPISQQQLEAWLTENMPPEELGLKAKPQAAGRSG